MADDTRALAELAKRNVLAVLSGHVHDPFDLMRETALGPVRMIGAGASFSLAIVGLFYHIPNSN